MESVFCRDGEKTSGVLLKIFQDGEMPPVGNTVRNERRNVSAVPYWGCRDVPF